jgi:hypothetical protein
MSGSRSRSNPLKEMESEVWAEGLEWMRRRLQKRLQARAEELGAVSPPQPDAADSCEPPSADAADDRR